MNFSENITIVFLGDSNIECAIDATLIDNSVNIAKSADSYFYSYLKLKQIISNNENIKTVFLGFSPHNVFSDTEKSWLLNKLYIKRNFSIYYPLMDRDDFLFLLFNNREGLFNAIPTALNGSVKNIAKYMLGIKIKYGGFVNSEKNNLNDALKNFKKEIENTSSKDISFEFAKFETIYLKKIVSLCEKNGIELFFVTTPKRIELWESEIYRVSEFYSYYANNFQNIPFLDFNDFYIPDSGFVDLMHLNHEGAKLFSEYLQNFYFRKCRILKHENNQGFIKNGDNTREKLDGNDSHIY